jgi:nucleoside-diphosphate-sugar epimerase
MSYAQDIMRKEKILVTGANGQIGSVLTTALRHLYGDDAVIATDIRHGQEDGHFELLNVLDAKALAEAVDRHSVTQIYHLAAILSAKGEADPLNTWHINMSGLFNILEVSREKHVSKVFHPSSIAVFGAGVQRDNTPQDVVLQPGTVYGMSKVAGELWAQYYFQKYGLDIRSLRYPGVIGHQSEPGGGTTDYAVEIYHYAVKGLSYTCFLAEHTTLPMIYMDDAIRAALELMQAPAEQVKVRTSYNLAAVSFCPVEIAASIQQLVPEFRVNYQPDYRQNIAESWPKSIDDTPARQDWNWKPAFKLPEITKDMLLNLNKKYALAGH